MMTIFTLDYELKIKIDFFKEKKSPFFTCIFSATPKLSNCLTRST